jgi:hypothetical protein
MPSYSLWFNCRFSGLDKVLCHLTILLASYLLYVCVLLTATMSSWWLGWNYSPGELVLVCLYENLLGQVCSWCTRKPGLNPLVAFFSTDRSNAINPRVLCCVYCLLCPFWGITNVANGENWQKFQKWVLWKILIVTQILVKKCIYLRTY